MSQSKDIRQLNPLETQAALADYAQRIHQRSEPLVLACMDCFDQWCAMAEDPGNPHYATARDLIRRWVQNQDRMRAIAAGIHVVTEPARTG